MRFQINADVSALIALDLLPSLQSIYLFDIRCFNVSNLSRFPFQNEFISSHIPVTSFTSEDFDIVDFEKSSFPLVPTVTQKSHTFFTKESFIGVESTSQTRLLSFSNTL